MSHQPSTSNHFAHWGLILGPLFASLCIIKARNPSLISSDAWWVIGLAVWVIIWWVSEAVPIGITSLLPIIYLSGSGVFTLKQATTPYGSSIIFLFLGGFILALALERWGIHKRIALGLLAWTGSSANGILLGFMLATALLSMWMSNTATTLMMLPIGMSVLSLLHSSPSSDAKINRGMEQFKITLMLGIAYSANIGGTMTLIGTPPNLALATHFSDILNTPISFAQWLQVGVPFGIIMLLLTYGLLVFVLFPNHLGQIEGAKMIIQKERDQMGQWDQASIRVVCIFTLTAFFWVCGQSLKTQLGLIYLNDTLIALSGALLLFVLPDGKGNRLMVWKDLDRLPWDIVLLFGGGLCLASAMDQVGLMQAIGTQFGHLGATTWFGIALLTLVALFMTEVMSNVALVTVFIPVVSQLAQGHNIDPLILCAPVTLAASCAFMLPISTPPNAIVFASGYLKMKHMVQGGLILNLVSVIWITFLIQWLLV